WQGNQKRFGEAMCERASACVASPKLFLKSFQNGPLGLPYHKHTGIILQQKLSILLLVLLRPSGPFFQMKRGDWCGFLSEPRLLRSLHIFLRAAAFHKLLCLMIAGTGNGHSACIPAPS